MSIEYPHHGQLAGLDHTEVAGESLPATERVHSLNTALILGNISLPQATSSGEGGGGETDQEKRRRELDEKNKAQNQRSEDKASGRGIRGPGGGS